MNRHFVPTGYVGALHLIEVVSNHLYPESEEHQSETEIKGEPVSTEISGHVDPFAAVVKDGVQSSPGWAAPLSSGYRPQNIAISAELERQVYEVLHTLRELLFAQKLMAFFVSPFGGGLTGVPRNFWLTTEADHALWWGEYLPLGRPYENVPVSPLFFKAGAIEAAVCADEKSNVAGMAQSSRAGAKPKFDWSAYEEDFMKQVFARGVPSELNVKGWQSQADVVRYLQGLALRDGLDLADSTAKPYAKAFLAKARADGN